MTQAETHARSLFFALQPDEDVAMKLRHAAQLAKAARRFSGQGRPAHTYHLTLYFLGRHVIGDDGEFPRGLVSGAIAAATSINLPAFDFVLDRVERLGRSDKAPCVLRAAALLDASLRRLHATLGEALRSGGLGRYVEERPFVPHVTVGYSQTRFDPLQLEQPIAWPVREFVLLESHIGKSLHERLAAVPLAHAR